MSEILDVTVHTNTSVRQLSITVINQDNQIRGSKDVFRFTLSEISVLCGPVRIGKGERKEETKKTQALQWHTLSGLISSYQTLMHTVLNAFY